jgi:hypothetical protein
MQRKIIFYTLILLISFFLEPLSIFGQVVNGNDSITLKIDSVIFGQNKLKVCMAIENNSKQDFTVVKPLPEFLDYNIITIDFISKFDFKKGFNSNRLSQNLQIDNITFKDSSSFVFLKPKSKQNVELLIDKSFFREEKFFEYTKECYLEVWYFHDKEIFRSKLPVSRVYNGLISSISNSLVRIR